MIFGIHPAFLIAGVGLLIAAVLVFFGCRARRGLATRILLFFALVFVLPGICLFLEFHPELIDGRFRTYKAFYGDIKVGMTRDQVIAAMEARYPQTGKRRRPKIMEDTPNRLGFFMNPETLREPNCEEIFLSLHSGRVVSKDYSPD
jgi:hypothetical protein